MPGENRFEDAARYAAYLESPEGRLRTDLAIANLEEHLPARSAGKPPCAFDLGCGTGAAAIRLARLGLQVTAVDSSSPMLEIAARAIAESRLAEKITLQDGDVAELASEFPAGSFDVILCHNVLEYVDDPGGVLRGAARLLRTSGVLSVLVRNRAGEVLKAALLAGDLGQAERCLDAQWARESLFGGQARLFTPETLQAMLKAAPLECVAWRGVRVVADYLPAQISRSAEYERIFAVERRLGERLEFLGIARYIQCMAQSPTAEVEQ